MKDDSFDLGQSYFYGDTKRKNYKKAFPLLLKAAKEGIPHAQNLIGYCFNRGLGIPKTNKKAFYWFQKAVQNKRRATQANRAVALCNLAIMYDFGHGIKKDSRKAFYLYKTAAKLGDSWAQCNLGNNYLEGIGCKVNETVGADWLKKAAKKGDDKAQYSLALCYLDGSGVKRNKGLAIKWLKKASKEGHKLAIKELKHLQT